MLKARLISPHAEERPYGRVSKHEASPFQTAAFCGLLRVRDEVEGNYAAFHLMEQPIDGVCSRGPRPVNATPFIASNRSRRTPA
jgi:hypothetical protein